MLRAKIELLDFFKLLPVLYKNGELRPTIDMHSNNCTLLKTRADDNRSSLKLSQMRQDNYESSILWQEEQENTILLSIRLILYCYIVLYLRLECDLCSALYGELHVFG
jgi:hypothetical protein